MDSLRRVLNGQEDEESNLMGGSVSGPHFTIFCSISCKAELTLSIVANAK